MFAHCRATESFQCSHRYLSAPELCDSQAHATHLDRDTYNEFADHSRVPASVAQALSDGAPLDMPRKVLCSASFIKQSGRYKIAAYREQFNDRDVNVPQQSNVGISRGTAARKIVPMVHDSIAWQTTIGRLDLQSSTLATL
jgi:hypothetical protein